MCRNNDAETSTRGGLRSPIAANPVHCGVRAALCYWQNSELVTPDSIYGKAGRHAKKETAGPALTPTRTASLRDASSHALYATERNRTESYRSGVAGFGAMPVVGEVAGRSLVRAGDL